MEICMYCEHYNYCTGRCEVTGQKKETDDSCKLHEHVPYNTADFDWEH